MATFIKCDFHGTATNDNNFPVNIDMVQVIEAYPGRDHIIFHFEGTDTFKWSFINAATRDLEYLRILGLVKPK